MKISQDEYQRRIDRLKETLRSRDIDAAVIYGDERAYENVRYFSGYAPIFEMALLIVSTHMDRPLLITGIEGTSSAELQTRGLEVRPYLPFTVQGMSPPEYVELGDLLAAGGVDSGHRTATIGTRYFSGKSIRTPKTAHSVPHFIVQSVIEVVGDEGLVINASELMTHSEDGLRIRKSANEIIILEAANGLATRGLEAMQEAVRPGITELELLGIAYSAAPAAIFSYWPIIHLGADRQMAGMDGPGLSIAETGENCMLYYPPTVDGYCANVGRVYVLAAGPEDLAPSRREIVPRLFAPIFAGYAGLLRELSLGVSGDQLWHAATQPLTSVGLATAYEPCTHVGLGEWENTFVSPGSEVQTASGMVLQADFTVVSDDPVLGVGQMEDGFALADQALRDEIAELEPQMWARVQERRGRLATQNIVLDESVLPLGDMAGRWAPYLLNPSYELRAD